MFSAPASRAIGRAAVVAAIAWFLFLPLRDIFRYPERISVLHNLETDAAAYDAFALDFANTWHISSLPAKHPPGWMVMLASVYATVGHSYAAGKLVSWFALALSVLLCAWMAHRMFGRTAATLAALLCASSPGLRGYVGTLQYEVVTGTLLMMFLVLTVRIVDAPSPSARVTRALLAGLVAAALVLTRETFVLVVMIAAAWVWVRVSHDVHHGSEARDGSAPSEKLQVRPVRDGRVTALALLCVAAVPPLIWSAAQTVHHGRLILIAEKGPKEFQLGNNPLANGTYNEPLVGMGEPAGFAFIREYTADAARLAGRKVLYAFGVLRDGWNVPHPATVWLWRATTGLVPLNLLEPVAGGGWLLIASLVALYGLGRDGLSRWWVLPVGIASILLVHVITIASFRFSVPLLPALYVLASGPLARFVHAAASALRTPAVAAGCAVIAAIFVAAQFQTWPLHVTYDAINLEGLAAANVVDDVSGTRVRFGTAQRGTRPIALLPDTYFPRGPLRLSVRMRRTTMSADDSSTIARITLTQLDGDSACAADVPAVQLSHDQFTDVTVLCRLDRDGPATLAVFSLGTDDLAVDKMQLAWR